MGRLVQRRICKEHGSRRGHSCRPRAQGLRLGPVRRDDAFDGLDLGWPVPLLHRSHLTADPTQPNLRQVHLIHAELFAELDAQGFDVQPGELGENITARHLDLLALPCGVQLRIGPEAVVEGTGCATRALRSILSSRICSTLFLDATATARWCAGPGSWASW